MIIIIIIVKLIVIIMIILDDCALAAHGSRACPRALRFQEQVRVQGEDNHKQQQRYKHNSRYNDISYLRTNKFHIYIYISIHLSLYVYIYIYIYVCMCMCIQYEQVRVQGDRPADPLE